jgi:hypothetical protein
VDTRNKNQLHRPIANFSCFQKGVSYAGVKSFDILPSSISHLRNDKLRFKVSLQRYLMDHSFYSLAEFLMHRKDIFMAINYNLSFVFSGLRFVFKTFEIVL